MKKFILYSLAFILSLNVLHAQKKTWSDQAKNELKSPRTPMAASDRAKIEAKEMTLHLDLNDKQQEQTENALLEYHSQIESIRKSVEKPKSTLTPEERSAMKSQHLDAQIALKRKMKTILNEQQYEEFSKRMGNPEKKQKPRSQQ